MGKEWRGTAQVRELKADPAVALERPAIDQIRDRSNRLKRELVQPDRVREGERVGGKPGMEEHVGMALVERLEQRLQRRIAEVSPGHVAEQHHPVESKLVVAALDL